ncbi:hypothetical protein HNV11_08495 [Spirosoma taeanense]|uniref:Uncharacterized protein n=1 Tax=Spirosoma taeanense TaxID=2735870 RepID=A0A6M5Y807_9BACT|nr:hypothetical protein [Spirosoma taeanense]QJW89420.1 hypothetical protein HNV11_08495 [Spirosoma taeanense]
MLLTSMMSLAQSDTPRLEGIVSVGTYQPVGMTISVRQRLFVFFPAGPIRMNTAWLNGKTGSASRFRCQLEPVGYG